MKLPPYRYLLAAIYTCALFLDRLDLTIVNITLPTLAKQFDVALPYTAWVNTAFLLALAISIPISSWLGKRFSEKRIFILAIVVFGSTSLLCAFAPNLALLAGFRFVQGLGGGLLIPVGMSLVYAAFDPSEYASITSFTFIPALIAPAIAPLLGGLLVDYYGCQWVFLFVFPICLVLTLAASLIIKPQTQEMPPPLDWKGFILAALFLSLLLYSLSNLARNGFNGVFLIQWLLLFIIGGLWFIHERQTPHPLIALHYFRHRLFMQANWIQLCFQSVHFGAIFLIGIFLQAGLGMSAVAAGAIMGMQALGAICVSRYSVKLFKRHGASLPIITGLSGVMLLTPCILLLSHAANAVPGLILLFLRGLCSGLCGTPIQTLSVIDFPKTEIAAVSAVFNACRQIAISLGTALSALLIAWTIRSNGLLSSNHYAFAFFALSFIALVGIVITTRIDNRKIIALQTRQKSA